MDIGFNKDNTMMVSWVTHKIHCGRGSEMIVQIASGHYIKLKLLVYAKIVLE